MQIVLVHGIWDTGRVFKRMASALEAAGHQCYCPSLTPAIGGNGLRDLANKLLTYIQDHLTEGAHFAIVGFSMGTIVSRIYMQELGGHEKVSHFFNISGPHYGTLTAHLWLGKGPRDMRFRSKLLTSLNQQIETLKGVEIHTYRTPFDLMILPSSSSELTVSQTTQTISAPMHHRMLVHPKVIEGIVGSLKTASSG